MWHARKDLLISFVVFTLSIAAGYFSCVQDPDFVYQILGSGYVEMTINNIERGDPLAVYKDSDAFNMFFRITWNNLRVAMITFLFGLFLGVGTFGILVGNGIMVGVFHHLFFRYDLGTEAILTILQHGALELSAIVIAGAAGIQIGRAWFFPGNYSRGQSFRYKAYRGVLIMIGLIPIIIMAGWIESFVTRISDMPDVVRALVILISFGFIIFYFVFFPSRLSVEVKQRYEHQKPIRFFKIKKLNINSLKSSGEIFTDTFALLKEVLSKSFFVVAGISLLQALSVIFFIDEQLPNLVNLDFDESVAVYFQFFDYTGIEGWKFYLINAVAFGLAITASLWSVFKSSIGSQIKGFKKFGFVKLAVSCILLQWCFQVQFYMPSLWLKILLLFINLPVFSLAYAICLTDKKNAFGAIGKSLSMHTLDIGKQMVSNLAFYLFTAIIFFLFSAPLLWYLSDYVMQLFTFEEIETLSKASTGFYSFFSFLVTHLVLILFTVAGVLHYFNLKEVGEAPYLKSKIAAIGND